jgi:hypothetical protein
MIEEFDEEVITSIVAFVREIGLQLEKGTVRDETLLPGIEIMDGRLVVDESKLPQCKDGFEFDLVSRRGINDSSAPSRRSSRRTRAPLHNPRRHDG